VRAPGIGFGLPHAIQERDERLVVETAVGLFGGDPNPHLFRYPTFFIYVLHAAFRAISWAWRLAGLDLDAPHLIARFDADGTPFYLAARAISLAAGLATVALVVALGRRFAGPTAGLVAGIVLALSPLHSEMSRFARVDAFMVFWTTAALTLATRHRESGRGRDAILAAFAAGLALATKYPAAFVIAAPLAAACLHARAAAGPRAALPWGRLLALAVIPFLVLLATSPFLLLDGRAFVAEMRGLARLVVVPYLSERGAPGPLFYPAALAGGAFGAGLLLAALVGLVALVRAPGRPPLHLLAFVVPYSLFFALSKTAYARFLLPILPVLAVLAAVGILTTARRLRVAWPIVLLVAFAPTAPRLASRVAVGATNGDTRIAALRFIEENVPTGSRVLIGDERRIPPLRRAGMPTLSATGIARQLESRPEVLGAVRRARAADVVGVRRPAYRIVSLGLSPVADAARVSKPDAIVLPDELADAAPEALAADYRVAAEFGPSWRRDGPRLVVLARRSD